MNVCVIDSRVCQRCRVLLYRRGARHDCITMLVISAQCRPWVLSHFSHISLSLLLFVALVTPSLCLQCVHILYSTVLPHFTYLIRYAIQQLQCRRVHIRLSVYLVHFKLIYKLLRVINKFKTANPNRDPFIHSTNLSIHKNIFVCLNSTGAIVQFMCPFVYCLRKWCKLNLAKAVARKTVRMYCLFVDWSPPVKSVLPVKVDFLLPRRMTDRLRWGRNK